MKVHDNSVQEYNWLGNKVKGTVAFTVNRVDGVSTFIELAEKPEVTYNREGHEWPIKGCIVMADSAKS